MSHPAAPWIAPEPRLWRHFCTAERLPLAVAEGDECSWCGAREREAPHLRVVHATAWSRDDGEHSGQAG